ncbi:MAG: tryptophan synthase subunit alpha [Fretibacterium sp.]|nr:tryptophan synthase subunit alpha [Fretibacterium sp.]
MSNIANAFKNSKAFIPYLACGDPDLETTAALVREMARQGADLIELGIPFSDPTAEGPVIQQASLRALQAGTTTDKIFDMVRDLRKDVTVPMVFMTYANVVFSYGTDKFLSSCEGIGMDGLILPDVPWEEKEDFAPACAAHGLDLISLIAPTSNNRIAEIARDAKGFVYIVSSLGVTGVRKEITTDIGAMVRLIRQNTDVPCAVGFGISTPDQARAMSAHADGVIVGSAIVKLIAQHGRDSVKPVGEYVRAMKEAI